VTLKVVPKAACDLEIVSKAGHEMYWRKSTKGKPKQKFHAAFGQSLALVRGNGFEESSRNLIFFFSFTRQAKKLKTIYACT
jgi:hypothetical protein